MIQIINDHEIHRGGVKIGWIEDNHIRDYTGKIVGSFSGSDIFKSGNTMRIGCIEGDYIKLHSDPNSRGIRLEDNMKEVSGGNISDISRAAVRLLLG